jgi:hypothetical protein
MAPGVRFTGGVSFSGVDIAQYAGRDLEVEIANGVVVIRAIY